MATQRLPFLAVLCAALVAAGCVEPRANPGNPGDFEFAAREGWFSVGYAYDGVGTEAFAGDAFVSGNHERNEAVFVAQGTLNGETWRFEMDRFYQQAPNRTFQDGGLAADLQEHGATGIGDASIPEVHVAVAGWGDLRLSVDGEPRLAPFDDNGTWIGHFMVVTTGVRDEDSHGIESAGRNGTYDPANATDGHADRDDEELHLVVKSRGGPGPDDTVRLAASGTVTTQSYSRDHPLQVAFEGTAGTLEVSVSALTLQTTRLTFQVVDAEGRPVAGLPSATLGQTAEGTATAELPLAFSHPGDYAVRVTGFGTNAQYTIGGAFEPPASIVLNLWWENVLHGADLDAVRASLGPGNGTA